MNNNLDTSTRRRIVMAAAVTVALVTAYMSYVFLATTEVSPVTETSNSNNNDTATISQQQNTTLGRPNLDPWYCSCYASDEGQINGDDTGASDKTSSEQGPLVIPDSFSKPDKALVDKINENIHDDRVLIVAASNYGMRDHVYNWIESLKRTGEGDKFLMFCLDDQMYQHMVAAGYEKHAATIPSSWFHQEVDAGFEEYYTKKYRIITHAKTLIVQQLLYLDVTVLFSDVDIVWLRPQIRDFIYTYLKFRPQTQVVFQQEGTDQRVVNSGFYMIRPSDVTKQLLAETIHLGDTNEAMTQQGAMNAALEHLDLDLRSTSVVLLDVMHFPNGYVYFSNDWPNRHGIEPFIVHANYLVSRVAFIWIMQFFSLFCLFSF